MKQYYQCLLRLDTAETVGWIEDRGAKVGAQVELLPSRERWTVACVYRTPLPEDHLKELQHLHRRSLPSIEPMV